MSKYNYKVSFDGAIKAGVSKEEYSRESSKLCILTWISNELAESNRLKKCELDMYNTHNKIYDDLSFKLIMNSELNNE